MKSLIWLMPLTFIIGCGDKDEDTGEDTAVEDTTEEVDDGAEGADTGEEEDTAGEEE